MEKTFLILIYILISMNNIYSFSPVPVSDKKLGSFVEKGNTYFRLFAPDAVSVSLITFSSLDDAVGNEHTMLLGDDGVWETSLEGEKYGLQYGFKVKQKKHKSSSPLCLDPYSKAVATFNTYLNPGRSIVIKEGDYDWEGDDWIQRDWRDLIIYEMHIRDMTAHNSSGTDFPGTYQGLIQKGKKGGIDYIKSLGINTIELLPAQEFSNIELPFKDSAYSPVNTWNPYERNHWGYMTSSYFAPESYFSENTKELEWNKWYGAEGKQVNDFKDMVKAFHKEGIAVIMDVVYNHIAQYEIGNLKEIDKKYYFRFDDKGNYKSESGTGNDFKTEAPMARRMIIESVLYWMKEYHIDGFRFDLARLIDWETVEDIIKEAKKINPYVIIVCEPWGGGYDPEGFSLRGWGSWNDQIRNGIKGENPVNGLGWIFGNWYGDNSPDRVKSYINGTLVRDRKGLFQKKEHSVNYLESHDGYTLGDFIRIGTKGVRPDDIIKDVDSNAMLSPAQLKLNKLAALFLFTSQGITMIHSGQEFARSKVIAKSQVKDKNIGKLDHNSYEKDNETNYINYHHSEFNKELVDYYKGLIQLRKEYPAFRRTPYENITFFKIYDNDFALGYHLNYDKDEFIVLFNAASKVDEEFKLPDGNWDILVDSSKAGMVKLGDASGKIVVKPVSGFVLRKNK
jgi:pullulanase